VLALDYRGQLFAWGANDVGQLGDGSNANNSTPKLVQGDLSGREVVAVACGASHSMALTKAGEIFVWGLVL
jgi:alpha-tubulin suppressor-like RCC1 family protein